MRSIAFVSVVSVSTDDYYKEIASSITEWMDVTEEEFVAAKNWCSQFGLQVIEKITLTSKPKSAKDYLQLMVEQEAKRKERLETINKAAEKRAATFAKKKEEREKKKFLELKKKFETEALHSEGKKV